MTYAIAFFLMTLIVGAPFVVLARIADFIADYNEAVRRAK